MFPDAPASVEGALRGTELVSKNDNKTWRVIAVIQLYVVGGAFVTGFAAVPWIIAIPLVALALLAASRHRLGSGVHAAGGSERALAVAIVLFGLNTLAVSSAAYLLGALANAVISSVF